MRLTERLRFKALSGADGGGRKYAGVLTMNVRNRDFIEKYNPRETHLDVTKLTVKEMLRGAGVPVPTTLATFDALGDLGNLQGAISEIPEGEGFVAKPNDSFGGRGILVIKRRKEDVLEKADGSRIGLDDLRKHIESAIDGEHSGRWLPDKAFLEELVVAHPDMARLSYSGLPDVRVIVFRGVPVMAMTRLPTRVSGGKANLARGALGGGICLTSGRIENVIFAHGGKTVKTHPDTGIELIGQQIPFWDDIIEMAVKAQRATGIGYAGVDIAVDAVRGPVVMEVNKRPGLEIQNATNRPLLVRLRAVEALLDGRENVTARDGIAMMQSLEASEWRPVGVKGWAAGGVAE
jgi:alpha-L-glutamate ligase-like protein